jgi:hypothetical protein
VPTDLNVAQAVRDSAILQAWLFIPLLVFSAVSGQRRWLLAASFGCTIVSWWILVGLWLHSLGGLIDAWPGRFGHPLPQATSFLIIENYMVVALFWMAAILARGVLFVVDRVRRVLPPRPRLETRALLALYTALATWFAHGIAMGDTIVAPRFTRAGWARIVAGMSRTDVLRVMGPPISEVDQPAFTRYPYQDIQCWLSNRSTGYFACVSFADHIVTTKKVWYSE